VKLRRTNGRYQSKLDKLLSVSEQENFVDDNEIIKKIPYPTDDDIEAMTKYITSFSYRSTD